MFMFLAYVKVVWDLGQGEKEENQTDQHKWRHKSEYHLNVPARLSAHSLNQTLRALEFLLPDIEETGCSCLP